MRKPLVFAVLGLVCIGLGVYTRYYRRPVTSNQIPTTVIRDANIIAQGRIPVDKQWIFAGRFKGKISVIVYGEAILYPRAGPLGPNGVNFRATSTYPLPGENEWCALARYNGKIVKVGGQKDFVFDTDTDLFLGPNDSSTEGAGFTDNSGSWGYQILRVN